MISAAAVIVVALLAYTYVGFPILIVFLSRLTNRRARQQTGSDSELPTVTVCLPVFNGAAAMPAKVRGLLAQDYPADKLDILIYCDGCTDDSEAVANSLAETPEGKGRVSVIVSRARLGKPSGLNAVVAAARGEMILLNDVRQPLTPVSARTLAAALADPEVGCAAGTLVVAGSAYWRYEIMIRKAESRFRGGVGMSGSIAMMRKAELEPLPPDIILDDVWIPMRVALGGRRVVIVPEAQALDAAFEDDKEFRRKVRTLAGNYQLFARMPALLSPLHNPLWFETISHKVLRLVAPWLLLALAVLPIVAAVRAEGFGGALMGLLVVGQVVFYGAAILGRRAGKLGGLARQFVLLNAAALVGLWKHLTGGQRVTW